MIIGLTGGIAAGKSTVASMLEELGATVVDADMVAREVMAPESPILAEVVEAFGDGILDSKGELDRKALRALVFSDAVLLERLNQITHPAIRDRIRCLLKPYRQQGVGVFMAPLLLENQAQEEVDQVWVVDVPEELQLERLRKRDGCSWDEGRAIMASQLPRRRRLELAHVVIDNSGGLNDTKRQVELAWRTHIEPSLSPASDLTRP